MMVWLILSLCAFNASAGVRIEVTQALAVGLPVAVIPFSVDGKSSSSHEIADVIRSDLQNSGQFSVSNFRSLDAFPDHSSAVDFQHWKSSGVEDIVVGRIEKVGFSKYNVTFELLDVVGHRREQTAKDSVMLAMRFENIGKDDFRPLAHHISDLIFERLIGVKGFFSTRIAYISVTRGFRGITQTLEVADFDGHNPQPLYRSHHPLMSPSWSSDGSRTAFVAFEKDRAGIYIADVSSGRTQRVTQFPGINGAPAWSPDGKTLALVLSKDGLPKIYTLELESKRLTRLTHGGGRDTEPRFTPDGRFVVFTSDKSGRPQIYKVPLLGGKAERVTFKGVYNARPSITPDGKRLVTLHRQESGSLFSIAVQNLKTGEVKILTETGLNDSPCVAPNGMMVLYGSMSGTHDILNAVSLDGRTKVRLPAQDGEVKDPAWSPFTSKY